MTAITNNESNINYSSTHSTTNNTVNYNISPCKDCTRENKCIGCHGTCNEYISWKAARLERSTKIYKSKIKDSVIIGYEVSKARKLNKSY